MMEFDWESAFWVNSAVARLVYSEKTRAAPIVNQARCALEEYLAPIVESVTVKAKSYFDAGDYSTGVSIITSLSVMSTELATKQWQTLWKQLMVTNSDGYSTTGKGSSIDFLFILAI